MKWSVLGEIVKLLLCHYNEASKQERRSLISFWGKWTVNIPFQTPSLSVGWCVFVCKERIIFVFCCHIQKSSHVKRGNFHLLVFPVSHLAWNIWADGCCFEFQTCLWLDYLEGAKMTFQQERFHQKFRRQLILFWIKYILKIRHLKWIYVRLSQYTTVA